MTKKISILAIIFSGILSENLYAETKNGKNTGTVGSEVVNTQEYVNKTINVLNPNTYDNLSPLITNKAVNKESDINGVYGWNATPKGDIFAYTLTDNNGKTVKDVNCLDGKGDTKPGNGNRYCSTTKQIEKNQPGNDGSCKAKDADGNEYALTIPYGYKCEDSYIVPDGYVKKEQGSGAYKEYFYRYWMSGEEAVKFCEPAFRLIGCWSPAYPIIAYNGFTGFNIPNTEAGAELAKTAFGTREPGDKVFTKETRKNIKNAYVTNNDYRMGVKVTPGTKNNQTKVQRGEHTDGETILTVRKWSEVEGKGLYPDFNYDVSATNVDNVDMGTTSILNSSKLAEVDGVIKNKKILPCGMFSDIGVTSKGTGVANNEGVRCLPNYARITKNNEKDQLYTYYNIALPNSNGGYVSPTEKDFLNVRACANCVGLKDSCSDLIQSVITELSENGKKSVSAEALVKELVTRDKFAWDVGTYSSKLTCSDSCLNQIDTLLPLFAGDLANE